jgi:hypothetical protein
LKGAPTAKPRPGQQAPKRGVELLTIGRLIPNHSQTNPTIRTVCRAIFEPSPSAQLQARFSWRRTVEEREDSNLSRRHNHLTQVTRKVKTLPEPWTPMCLPLYNDNSPKVVHNVPCLYISILSRLAAAAPTPRYRVCLSSGIYTISSPVHLRVPLEDVTAPLPYINQPDRRQSRNELRPRSDITRHAPL